MFGRRTFLRIRVLLLFLFSTVVPENIIQIGSKNLFVPFTNQKDATEAQLVIPRVKSFGALTSPETIFSTVSNAWDVVLENQAGNNFLFS